MPSSQSISSDEVEGPLPLLHAQLSRARADYRQERLRQQEEYRNDLTALAEARNEVELRENQADSERKNLHRLRQMFLQRWRTQWAAERTKIQLQRDELTSDQIALESDRRTFDETRTDFDIHVANEKARIHKGWEDLSTEEQDWRLRWGIAESQGQRRQEELDRYAQHLAQRESEWLTQEAVLKATCEERTRELAGLERRIAVARQQIPIAATASTESRIIPAISNDERLLFRERSADLLSSREQWRDELAENLREFEEIGERIQQRESELDQREVRLRVGEEHIHSERRELHKLRKQLEALQARLNNQAAERKIDRELLEAEVRHLHAHRKSFRQGLTIVVDQWGERQSKEQNDRVEERGRCLAILQDWTENLKSLEIERADCDRQTRNLAGEAIVLERARVELLEKLDNPELARKRVERYEKRLRRLSGKTEGELESRRKQLQLLIEELRDTEIRLQDRLDELARERAESIAQVVEREQQLELDREAVALQAGEVQLRKGQLRQRDHTIRQLQEEIERLSRLLYDGEAVPLLRAA